MHRLDQSPRPVGAHPGRYCRLLCLLPLLAIQATTAAPETGPPPFSRPYVAADAGPALRFAPVPPPLPVARTLRMSDPKPADAGAPERLPAKADATAARLAAPPPNPAPREIRPEDFLQFFQVAPAGPAKPEGVQPASAATYEQK